MAEQLTKGCAIKEIFSNRLLFIPSSTYAAITNHYFHEPHQHGAPAQWHERNCAIQLTVQLHMHPIPVSAKAYQARIINASISISKQEFEANLVCVDEIT